MCVIIGKMAEQEKPTEELLRACWKSNPHGGGLMWRQDDDVVVIKGLMSINTFLKACNEIPDGVETWYHFRIVSRGSICTEQCHPFYLPGEAWFMHNGTFHIEPFGGMSDTQTVAEYINTNNLDADDVISGLCKESYSKAVILRPGEKTALYGSWSEYEGYKVSNLYFVDSLQRKKVKDWSKSRTLCETCALYGVDCYSKLYNYWYDCPDYREG